MIKNYFKLLILFFILTSMNGCATIFGGARYNAQVVVKDKPNASIYYNGENKGTGSASFLIKRAKSNQLEILIKEEGHADYVRRYDSKVPRLGAVLGTVSEISQMILAQTLAIPLGSIIDLASGAYWKPNVSNDEITKVDYDNFTYIIDCSEPQKQLK